MRESNEKNLAARVGAILRRAILCGAATLLLPNAEIAAAQDGVGIDFNRDIRPVLAANCYACHGPDARERKAGLRLDRKEDALKALKDGGHAIVPGAPKKSRLIERIRADDPEESMPPPESGKALTAAEKDKLEAWVAQGATWTEHWAYRSLSRPPVPSVRNTAWPRTPIDHFVLANLEAKALPVSPEADRTTLARRLTLDLLGLPPRTEDVARYHEKAPEPAYDHLLDELLRSPHYGERMAVFWLDLVRFADTRGYHSDNPRPVAPYRDYVIQTFNDNVPFDRFTLEQLAGDLLPEPTLWQRVASCYNKLLQTTEEGGAQPKEYEAINASDRVRNVSSVWMGATLGCAQCHDHKFDPYGTKDFYTMAAFFADIQERAIKDPDRGISLAPAAVLAELEALDATVAALEEALKNPPPEQLAKLDVAQAKWVREAAEGSQDGLPGSVQRALAVPPEDRREPENKRLTEHFRSITPLLDDARKQLHSQREQRSDLAKKYRRCLVSVSGEAREVRILERGNWMDTSGPVVAPAIPEYFGALELGGRRGTRLDLARWLVSHENPLTARVFVNRLWKLFYGAGLSKGLEDLGAMGEPPVHPELLDWLAFEFIESGWDIKHMVRLLVRSSTYRQSSVVTEALRERDPYNRLLARQSSWRLDAEVVRDNALAISGLLAAKIGGPSAKPYQPEGYWVHLNFPKRKWDADSGEGLYRRGLYTWWQRSFPHPSLMAFDAPNREECTADRPRSNIPQQALVLLNDPTYVEAARVFAEHTMRQGGEAPEERVRWAFRRALARWPTRMETAVLVELYQKHRASYEADPAAAEALLAVGNLQRDPGLDVADAGAWTSVTRAILNLHETVTRN